MRRDVGQSENDMRMIRNILLAIVAYVIVAIISGQIIMCGQGDTPAISARYGVLYVLQGGGITDIIRDIRLREFHSATTSAAVIQILVAVGMFCGLQFRDRKTAGMANHAQEDIRR